ncbi:MAG: FecR family protein [Odoribacter sp.]
MMKNEEISRLIVLHLTGEIKSDEKEVLMNWVEECDEHKQLLDRIIAGKQYSVRYNNYRNTDWQKALNVGEHRLGISVRRRKISLFKYAAIAILLVSITTLAWVFIVPQKVDPTYLAEEITAGTIKATLTLANGEKVTLHKERQEEEVIYENVINHPEKQQLQYEDKKIGSGKFNKLNTPRAGEYSLILADGTLVHLNAESELRYPVTFDKKKREVFLKGEAWFEVAKDSITPFYVKTENVSVKVYGTQFNINTSLLGCEQIVLAEGKIGLTINGQNDEKLLNPSQLAQYNKSSNRLEIKNVNIRPYIAWKDGFFAFSNERLETILNRLSAWYDVRFIYKNESAKDFHFTGSIMKDESMNVILNAMQKTLSVKFIIKGREIIVFE